jgi:hypothetical protein
MGRALDRSCRRRAQKLRNALVHDMNLAVFGQVERHDRRMLWLTFA